MQNFIKNNLCKVSRRRAQDRDRNPSRPRRDLRDRDFKKRVSRPRPSLETLSMINRPIVQLTSCEPPLADVQIQLKTYFFVLFARPCMHHNYGVFSGSHACRDCVWHIILDAELYTTCSGERVLVAAKFNVRFQPLRLFYENTCTCFSKDAENLTTYGYVL